MKNEILLLGVVGLLLASMAKADVDKFVGKSAACLENPTYKIQCKGKNFYEPSENYFLNIEYKQPCINYRNKYYGYWNIELKLINQQNLSLVTQMSNFGYTDLNLVKFNKNTFTSIEPFEINLIKSDEKYSSLQTKKIKKTNTNSCKPGSAMTDDICQTTSYTIQAEEYFFEDMTCTVTENK